MSGERVPVTIIGGYLGAGKTTLINRILTGHHGLRMAVIVNDFGDVAIDEALMAPATGGLRALANGCVCCSAVDGLATALTEIRTLDPPPEHLVIEVSGVGDPWAVAQWGRTPGFELAGVVVVADPTEIQTWAEDRYVGEGVRQQLAVADAVVLSRTDVAPPAELDATTRWLASVTDAPVLRGTDTPLAVLLGPTQATGSRTAAPHGEYRALSFVAAPASRQRATGWLDRAPIGVVRVKGFVAAEPVAADFGIWLVQKVGRRAEVSPHRGSGPREPVVVVITHGGADPSAVESWVEECRGRAVGPA